MSPIIRAAEVAPMLADSEVIIVDARGGADAQQRYANGHLAGAVLLDLETDLSRKYDPSRGGRHPLPEASEFAALLGREGIGRDTHVLVYDDKSGANAAARFWWMMKSLGHEKIQVIDGGLDALKQAGHQLSRQLPAVREQKPPYPASEWGLPQADMNMVNDARSNDDWLVIDVRENFRFRGESEPIDLIAGHIPGAVNIPYANNLEADGTFRSTFDLKDTYSRVIGDRVRDKVIVHCGSGVTACHTILAMAYAGLPFPRLYVGSWSEWSRNENPIATDEKP